MCSAYKLPLLLARSGESLGQDQRHWTSIGAWWWSCQRREGPRSAPQTGFSAGFRAAQLRGSSDAASGAMSSWRPRRGVGLASSSPGACMSEPPGCLLTSSPKIFLPLPQSPQVSSRLAPLPRAAPAPLQMTSNFSQRDSLFWGHAYSSLILFLCV